MKAAWLRRGWGLITVIVLTFAAAGASAAESVFDLHAKQKRRYLENREAFERDRTERTMAAARMRFCTNELLNPGEQKVAGLLSNYVAAYFETHRTNPRFGPARPFYEAKAEIAGSDAFKLLTKMPKGALLHAHFNAIGRLDWVIRNALTLSNCYVYWPAQGTSRGNLEFFTPEGARTNAGFVLASELAGRPGFTEQLRAALSVDATDVSTNRTPWQSFEELFGRTGRFVRHRSVFTNYLIDAFQTLLDDGVYYVELRDSFGPLADADKKDYGGEREFIDQFNFVREVMKKRHAAFDCRLIYADFRGADADGIVLKMREALRLSRDETNLIVGFDLIGEESGKLDWTTRVKVAEVQRKIAADPECYRLMDGKVAKKDLPYFLHDGESSWADNDNLIDAVLLGAPRIGHAFNLYRFPSLYDHIKATDIALEICPISNQLLGLSPDLRTHPAAGYLNAGIQCVLASDDPLFFGNDGLSYDFWEALIAWNLDLAALKKLARNSITYSGLEEDAKEKLMNHWNIRWDDFIAKMANGTTGVSALK